MGGKFGHIYNLLSVVYFKDVRIDQQDKAFFISKFLQGIERYFLFQSLET